MYSEILAGFIRMIWNLFDMYPDCTLVVQRLEINGLIRILRDRHSCLARNGAFNMLCHVRPDFIVSRLGLRTNRIQIVLVRIKFELIRMDCTSYGVGFTSTVWPFPNCFAIVFWEYNAIHHISWCWFGISYKFSTQYFSIWSHMLWESGRLIWRTSLLRIGSLCAMWLCWMADKIFDKHNQVNERF